MLVSFRIILLRGFIILVLCFFLSFSSLFFNLFIGRPHRIGSRVGHDHSLNHINNLLDKKIGPVSSDASTTYFYNDAILDHFTGSFAEESATWSQRYYVDTSFWGGEGYPVFL
jgi:hypothetical protein